MKLKWSLDPSTASWASKITLIRSSQPQRQYDGTSYRMWEDTWRKYILVPDYPAYCRYLRQPGYLLASPSNIIACFQENKVLQALALVVAWGSMVRTAPRIYTRPLSEIEDLLVKCLGLVRAEESIESSWNLLIDRLQWSAVITSKCLHFLSRAVGCEENPPVPIDNGVILNKVWPEFEKKVKSQLDFDASPSRFRWWSYSPDWGAYNRYMTAIICWAELKGWTTTQVENTLFHEYT